MNPGIPVLMAGLLRINIFHDMNKIYCFDTSPLLLLGMASVK
jgi:hypothetical protein